jgi:hypothetical protein
VSDGARSRTTGATVLAGRAALVIAHPGHELLAHGWLELARPIVFVLTDGSGRTNRSRIDGTTKVLEQTGARPSPMFGGFTDRAAYTALLEHRVDFFIDLAEELARALAAERIDYVVGDAEEGYNPMHDVCRLVIDAAVRAVHRTNGRHVANFKLPIVGWSEDHVAGPSPEQIRVQLTEDAFARKVAAASRYIELQDEMESALRGQLINALRVERFRLVGRRDDEPRPGGDPRFYEQYGEKQVAAGYYTRVLRHAEHVAPLAETLLSYARSSTR